MRNNVIMRRIGKVLPDLDVDLGYVLGSYLTEGESNDMDVAILSPEELSSYELFKEVLSACPVSFQHTIIKNGTLVSWKDEFRRIRYEEDVPGYFMNDAPTFRWLDKACSS